jgi:hypothetical protein
MKRLLNIAAALGLLLFLTAGCSQDGTPSGSDTAATDDYTTIDLGQDFGGLTVTDENTAFDDPELKAMLAMEAQDEVVDPVGAMPDVMMMDRMGREASAVPDSLRPQLTFLSLRWGHLSGLRDALDDSAACDGTDWTGSLSVDRGVLVVRRKIAFESPRDHIVFPRIDRRTVALVSHTGCGFDGLVVQVIERPDTTGAVLEPNRLHINLGPYTADFDVADLATIEEVVAVDASGNSMELTGFNPREARACPKGFLSARYRHLPADRPDSLAGGGTILGHYAGAWRTLDGRLDGFMRGAYGLDADGQHVFVGKYIGRNGHFRGRIRGTWAEGLAADDLVSFEGQWFGAAGAAEGVLAGDGHPVEGSAGGFLVGRWATLCDPDAVDTVR